MGISPSGLVYMTQELAAEASYTIRENDYWHDSNNIATLVSA